MKITRHTAKDMRQALRLVRDQLGPEAVILTSKRTPFGVEVTAAIDFDAARIEAQASGAPSSDPRTFRPEEFVPPSPAVPPARPRPEYDPYTIADEHEAALARAEEDVQQSVFARIQAEVQRDAAGGSGSGGRAPVRGALVGPAGSAGRNRNGDVVARQPSAPARAVQSAVSHPTNSHQVNSSQANSSRGNGASQVNNGPARVAQSGSAQFGVAPRALDTGPEHLNDDMTRSARGAGSTQFNNAAARAPQGRDAFQGRDAVQDRDTFQGRNAFAGGQGEAAAFSHNAVGDVNAALESAIDSYMAADGASDNDESSLATPMSLNGATRANATNPGAGTNAIAAETGNDSDMGAEMKAMRRILETQMAQLAWNDLSRRAPVHTEILRELTEVGLTQEFAAQIVAQLPIGVDITKARRLSIALISQQLNVTGDTWLDKGGRIALVGPTGVGKTTALAKLAVRWVLRHGARSIALISADSIRIGAHDQMQALGQMIDVPVYVAETFADIPKLLEQLVSQRFVLIDTPGMSQRDPQLAARMQQLADSDHDIETALVLSASTQAGAIAETVARFATANAKSALLTKVDEAASLGGILSVLAKAQMPISYVSEGQRVPEDLRPARSLELVSSAVQLAKSSGAAADEDLLRRRYGEVAHALA